MVKDEGFMAYKEFHDSTVSIKRSFLSGLLAISGTVLGYLLFAFLIWVDILPESSVAPIVFSMTGVCAFFAGFFNALRARQSGWANGAFAGGVYMLFYYLFSIIAGGQFSLCFHMIGMILLGLFSATIGGILGINFRANRKCRKGR